jgi:hypothetical protein
MKAIRIEDTEVRTVTSDSPMGTVRLHNFYGQGGAANDGPQGFLVEMLVPHSRLDPHFHDVDQFQVVVRGDGRMGGRKLGPVSVHYADAFAPYGPIVAKEHGLGYYTLRMVCAGGFWTMPANREKSRVGRQFTRDFDIRSALPEQGNVERVIMRDDEPDGLAIMGLRMGPNTKATGRVSDGGGQYLLICAGSIVKDSKTLPTDSLLLLEAGEPAPEFHSGPDGAAILIMQFARPTERPGSNPKDRARDSEYWLPPTAKLN